MAAITNLLGETVQGKDGDVAVSSFSVPGGVLAMYFSAHWCPPCRAFTPKLATWYNNFKKSENGSKLELVFVSSDRDEEAFNEYYAEMPWLTLPYAKRDEKAKLSKKFKVQGIPSLVFLNAETGDVITKNGRNIVDTDEDGKEFPWVPKTMLQMLSGPALGKGGEIACLAEAIKGKVFGIYFSAHWCPPCRGFTPELVKTYEALKEAGKNFEVIFASSDQSEEEFNEYYGEMPWLALPHEDKRKDELDSHFEVDGIPTLVLLDENLDLITTGGRGSVGSDPEGKEFPWLPPALAELSGANANALNDTPTLVYFTGAKEELIENFKTTITSLAEKTKEETKAKDLDDIFICYEGPKTGSLTESLRSYIKLEKPAPCVVYLDIGEQKKCVFDSEGEPTLEEYTNIIKKIRQETLDTVPIRED